MFRQSLLKKIKKSGLIGRGCNNFLVAEKWEMVKRVKGAEKFVVCNISESEPGIFKDKYILEKWPQLVLDGINLAMHEIKAKKGFVYLNPLYYGEFQASLEQIILKNNYSIELFEKPLHDYVGGEETAVLNSMQGLRVEPRLKPPYPTKVGFYGAPTLIHNCETFYAVSLTNSGVYKNTRFYCLSGVDRANDVKELATDLTVRAVLQEFDHTPSVDFFYQVGGGAAGFCYNYKQLNRKFEGSPAIIIYKNNDSEQAIVMKWLDFFRKESCGQCVPCREGTFRLRNLMYTYYQGGKLDKKAFDDLILSLQKTSLCALGRTATNAVVSYFKNVKGI